MDLSEIASDIYLQLDLCGRSVLLAARQETTANARMPKTADNAGYENE